MGPSSVSNPEKIRWNVSKKRISNYIEPKIIADTTELKTDDGEAYISVSAINHSGVFSFDGRYYIRDVSSNERVPVGVLFRIYQSRGFDAMREQPPPVQDLNFSHINAIMIEYAIHWETMIPSIKAMECSHRIDGSTLLPI